MAKTKGVIDLVILVDNTGSMSGVIGQLKSNIIGFIDTLTSAGGQIRNPVKDWRAKVVGFGDVAADRERWWSDAPFTSDKDELKAQVSGLSLIGGGDEPESFLDALWMLTAMKEGGANGIAGPGEWRARTETARIIAAFTDASAHPRCQLPEANGASATEIAERLMQARIRMTFYAPSDPTHAAIAGAKDCQQEVTEDLGAIAASAGSFNRLLEQLAKTVSDVAAVKTA